MTREAPFRHRDHWGNLLAVGDTVTYIMADCPHGPVGFHDGVIVNVTATMIVVAHPGKGLNGKLARKPGRCLLRKRCAPEDREDASEGWTP